MRGFLIVAVGAAALAGCAPFEHGHYASDVKYMNSNGDPAGTPLVFNKDRWGDADSTQTAHLHDPEYRATDKTPEYVRSVGSQDYWSDGQQHTAQATVSHQPVYIPPATQQASYTPPQIQTTYTAPTVQQAYTAPTVQQIYTAPAIQPSYAPTATYAPSISYQAPVTYTAPAVTTAPAQIRRVPLAYSQSAYTPATTQTLSATSHGGIQVDSEGYAICNESYPQGAQTAVQQQISHVPHTHHRPQMPAAPRGLSSNY